MEIIPHELKISSVAGSHYEIGTQLGQKVKSTSGPNYVDDNLITLRENSLYQSLGMVFDLTPKYIDEVFPVIEGALKKVHPKLLEEMKGFAEGLGEDYRKFVVFTSNFGIGNGCSEFFLNGSLARNYDDEPSAVEGDFLIISPKNSFKSFGASTSFIERLDGINEKGVAVGLTFGAGHPPKNYGFGSAIFTRIVLDKAASVEEAVELFKEVPYVTPNNVLIADVTGKAVVIEVSADHYQFRKPGEGIFICANSYLNPEMQVHQKTRNKTTAWREKQMIAMQHDLSNREKMMDFLTTDFPQGLFEPYFTDGLGTLWSVIYTPSNRDIYLATGEKGPNRREVKLNLDDQNLEEKLPITLSTVLHNVDLGERIPEYKS